MNARARFLPAIAAFGLLAVLTGCDRGTNGRLQGYAEGEYVYIASPLAGTVEALHVRRGDLVEKGAPLFALESVSEEAARDEAQLRLAQARAILEDARKGRRPSEMNAIEAQLAEARAALDLSERELSRQEELFGTGAVATADVDRARAAHRQNEQRVAHLAAELETARLGARTDQVAAAEAEVRALEAALVRAEWSFSQKRQAAPQSGVIFDTLYREGEWVAPGRPVVSLLPPENIMVRAFVPEPLIGTVQLGEHASVFVDGIADPIPAKVSFISPRAEYTPPVIYSRESRAKLVFMIELAFEPDAATRPLPGQPVDVQLAR